ncbi:hypothetical protein BASA81_013745 [Batrachochytrium salamandrivorans]|nr:hypothetical protein BASA81_013745 [Batrachochytrium salamandrivorans]
MQEQQLRALLQSHSKRDVLVHQKLSIATEQSMKLRFCCAMEDMLEDKEDKQRERKIVSTFLESGSLFQLENVPKALTTADQLGALHDFVLQELCQVPEIAAAMEATNQSVSFNIDEEEEEQKEAAVAENDMFGAEQEEKVGEERPRPQSLAKVKLTREDPRTLEFYDTVLSPKTKRKPSLLARTLRSASNLSTSSVPLLLALPSLSEEEKRLEAAIADPVTRRELILKLASTFHADLSIKVRLCQAISDYAEIPLEQKSERKARGRKIVSLFIQTGSLFAVEGIPGNVSLGLVKDSKFDLLILEVKPQVLDELLANDVVRNQVFGPLEEIDEKEEEGEH